MKSRPKTMTTVNRIYTDYQNKYLFNAAEIYSFLLTCRELREHEISMNELFDGGIQISIGDSIYQIFQAPEEEANGY